LFDAVTRAQWSFIARERLSNLAKALSADTESINQGTQLLLQFPAAVVTALVQVTIALLLAPLLTVAVVTCGGVIAAAVGFRRGDAYGSGRQLADARRAAFDVVGNFLAALKLAKSHNAEARHRQAFAAAAERQRANTIAFMRRSTEARLLLQIAAAGALGAFVYVGATIAHLAAPELLVMIVIFARLMPLLGELEQSMHAVRNTLPVFDDVLSLIHRCEAAIEATPDGGTDRLVLRNALRFDAVSFRYDEDAAAVLDRLDLVVPAGSVVAIVGASGAGKSTVADIVMGLLVPQAGAVSVDGEPLHGPRLTAWRRSVAYVPQDHCLFNDTVRANLLWAWPEAGAQELRDALASTGADRTIAAIADGIDTVIGERGNRLSGGERQRLALACALLRRPTLLVLDEATNALDQESERVMWALIDRLRGTTTVVVIAHRLSMLGGADRIVVLEDGRLGQSGTWTELMADHEGRFARLARGGADANGAAQ
jgi:ATP-binding cassette subfamily C protein